MFKDEFRSANDSIHADEALVNKVLALKDIKNRPKRRKPTYYLPAAAAAVVIVSASIASVPFLTKEHDEVILQQSVVTEERAADMDAVLQEDSPVIAAEQIPRPTSVPPAVSKSIAPSSTDVPYITEPPKRTVPATEHSTPIYGEITPAREPDTYVPTAPEVNHVPSGRSEATASQPDETADLYAAPESVSETAQSEPVAKITNVVLSMNSEPEMLFRSAKYLGEPYEGELTYTTWTSEEYFDYLGRALEPELGADFSEVSYSDEFDVSLKEDGEPLFDNRAFAYEGQDGRYVSIQTSKDTNTALNYLADSSYTPSNVDGTRAVLIGTVEDCTGYMICGRVSYVINAHGLNEEELKALLLSIVG